MSHPPFEEKLIPLFYIDPDYIQWRIRMDIFDDRKESLRVVRRAVLVSHQELAIYREY